MGLQRIRHDWATELNWNKGKRENTLPRWHSAKESICQCKRCRFDPWVWKIPCRRKWQPTPVLLPGKFHGQRSLTGYNPWGYEESDMTEHRQAWALKQILFSLKLKRRQPRHLWQRGCAWGHYSKWDQAQEGAALYGHVCVELNQIHRSREQSSDGQGLGEGDRGRCWSKDAKIQLYEINDFWRYVQHRAIPGTEEPGGLPSMGSHRVRHDWSDLAAAAAAAGPMIYNTVLSMNKHGNKKPLEVIC